MHYLTLSLCLLSSVLPADSTSPLVDDAVVFEEQNGILAVEAEHFFKQEKTEPRAWHLMSSESVADIKPDGDPPHVAGASGGAYIEALPDTRRTHDAVSYTHLTLPTTPYV